MALARDAAEVPSMSTVHPRDESLLDAMPAWDKTTDTVGVKWVAHYPMNPTRELPVVSGLVVVNDPDNGVPLCVMDGGELTARRTAAVSGAAVRLFAPVPGGETPPPDSGAGARRGARAAYRIGFIGAGTQARMHLELLAETLGRLRISVFDAIDGRAEALAAEAERQRAVLDVTVADGVEGVCEGADVLVSAASSRALRKRVVRPEMLARQCLVLTVDWATMIGPEVAQDAGLLLVDDLSEYGRARDQEDQEWFAGFPRPHGSLGRALLGEERLASAAGPGGSPGSPVSKRASGTGQRVSPATVSPRDAVVAALGGQPDGRVMIGVLGVAAVDILIAGAVYRVAAENDVGQVLPR